MPAEQTTWIYRLQPAREDMLSAGPTEQEAAILEAHGEYLDQQAAYGLVRLAGRTLTTDAKSFGIVILEVDSEMHARMIMDEDPAVSKGVLVAELFPFRIAVIGE